MDKLKLTLSARHCFIFWQQVARLRGAEADQRESPVKPDNYKSSQWSPDMSRDKGPITLTSLKRLDLRNYSLVPLRQLL
ncbi:hypothetical protein NPIL_126731 [Nephila pilipes]|uniref:Uncharacterized protein n=1 Tax=Nephila pilipes TaxID=299642 RepID=A0A8X6TVR5_NEPPI|nr:hypothetical protein NPIL_126731 [Nephila pilipes]